MIDIEKKIYLMALAFIVDNCSDKDVSEISHKLLNEIGNSTKLTVTDDFINVNEIIAFAHSKLLGE